MTTGAVPPRDGARAKARSRETTSMSRKLIDECVRASVEEYFRDLGGAEPDRLHDLFMAAAERPLLDVVLRRAEGNQSKAAEWLGINRNTLRRKLLDHRLVK
jgi:Fis family transcriptional regulator